MNGKKLIEEMLDLLVKMSEHCKSMTNNSLQESKCLNCSMSRNFGYSNHGCLLVDTLENYEFIDLLRDTCKYQDIRCEDKLNKAFEIFVTECEE